MLADPDISFLHSDVEQSCWSDCTREVFYWHNLGRFVERVRKGRQRKEDIISDLRYCHAETDEEVHNLFSQLLHHPAS